MCERGAGRAEVCSLRPAACGLYMPVYASNMAGALQESVVDVQVYRLSLLAGTPATSRPLATPGESHGREFRISTKSHSLS